MTRPTGTQPLVARKLSTERVSLLAASMSLALRSLDSDTPVYRHLYTHTFMDTYNKIHKYYCEQFLYAQHLYLYITVLQFSTVLQ